jgi:hypothetical protein
MYSLWKVVSSWERGTGKVLGVLVLGSFRVRVFVD